MLSIKLEAPDQEEVQAFLRQADERSSMLYPQADRSGPKLDSLISPNVRFFVARRDGRAIGCGGFAIDSADTAELKRIFVAPDARGQGVGGMIVEAIEDLARRLGIRVMRLETGIKSGEAIGLYRRLGYQQRESFGSYDPDPLSVFMEKCLKSHM